MANSFLLRGGPQDIQLQYNAASQTEYRLRYGARLQVPEPAILFHRPDDAPPQPVRAYDLDRTFFFEFVGLTDGTDWDAALDAINEIKRLVDGARSQALRYHMGEKVERVTLRVQLDTADNYTDQIVHFGYVDDGAAFYQSASQINKHARGVVVALTFTPYGEGAAIELHNDIANPAFLFESATAGLAANWSRQLSPTVSLDTDIWLIGGQSQKVVTNAISDQAIQSDTVTVSASTNLNAYIWIYHGGGDDVSVFLRDGSSTIIDSATVTEADPGAAADKSAVDEAGNTWYRIPLSGSNTNADAFLQIRRGINDATQATTFYVDGAYLDAASNSLTIPDAWMSASAIENRNDQTTGNPERINYYDVWGIPGDAPALVRHKLNATGLTFPGQLICVSGKTSDGLFQAAEQPHWVESDELSAGSGTLGSFSSGTGTSDNHYLRFTASGGTGSGSRYETLTGDAARAFFAQPRHLFAAVRASSTAVVFSAEVGTLGPVEFGVEASVNTTSTWELVDLGAIDLRGRFPNNADAPSPSSYPSVRLQMNVAEVPNTETADIDFLFLPWLEEFAIFYFEVAAGAVSGQIWLDGFTRQVLAEKVGWIESAAAGSIWEAWPGPRATRFAHYIVSDWGGFDVDLAITASVSLSIRPRTRHLLGAS